MFDENVVVLNLVCKVTHMGLYIWEKTYAGHVHVVFQLAKKVQKNII